MLKPPESKRLQFPMRGNYTPLGVMSKRGSEEGIGKATACRRTPSGWHLVLRTDQDLGFSSLMGGIEDGAVRARSGCCWPLVSAEWSISMAWPVLAGAKTVAASI